MPVYVGIIMTASWLKEKEGADIFINHWTETDRTRPQINSLVRDQMELIKTATLGVPEDVGDHCPSEIVKEE